MSTWPSTHCGTCWAKPGVPCETTDGRAMRRCHPGRREKAAREARFATRLTDTVALLRLAGLTDWEIDRLGPALSVVVRLARRLLVAQGRLPRALAERTAWAEAEAGTETERREVVR